MGSFFLVRPAMTRSFFTQRLWVASLVALLLLAVVDLTDGQRTSDQCGKVFDGLTEGKFDLQYQTSTTTLGANWGGFPEPVLFYEWAIFTHQGLPAQLEFSQCYQQIRRLPDVQGWVKANKQRQVMNTRLALQMGSTYHVAVRATLVSGEQLVAFSNGVTVVERDNSAALRSEADRREPSSLPSLGARQVMETSGSCSIDDNNRCRQAQISVADRLNELYGPPRFEDFSAPAGFVYADQNDDGGDDDDNADLAWVVAPVVGGVLLIALCLCLLLVLAALLARGLPEREPRESKPKAAAAAAPVAFVEQDEQKAYGMRDDMDVVDASTNTVVEFPDTQIRRLSISHKDEDLDPGLGGEPKRGRAPHPIMVSASSSFRDYRSGVNH